MDFVHGTDLLHFNSTSFGGAITLAINSHLFNVMTYTTGIDTSPEFLYAADTHSLVHDADGSGAALDTLSPS